MTRTSRVRALLAGATVTGALAALPSAAAASAAPAASVTWRADLSSGLAGSDNVATHAGGLALARPNQRPALQPASGSGTYVAPEQRLDRAVNRVRVRLDARVPVGAAVVVEVRGRRPGGGWTEWRSSAPAHPALLPAPSLVVQARLTLLASADRRSPVVRTLVLTGDRAPASASGEQTTPLTYRVFATREGLVGGTTANGHVIVSHDHFVALPSRRALSPNGTRTYAVRVCYGPTKRCETAPVWDVGPWNTTDDYWNPSSVRQSWSQLPQGRPEAQAAYNWGFNGGKDQFGRTVTNPAGIDLADGTFWDGLHMTDNGWVRVTFLWT